MNDTVSADERIPHLVGGMRPWYDVSEQRIVGSATVYVPYGCPDWGEKNGARNGLCTFCALPNAVADYRAAFYAGNAVPCADHIETFQKALAQVAAEAQFHTLMIFNAGSYLAMPTEVQVAIMHEVMKYPFIQRVVVEGRAPLVTSEALVRLREALPSKELTVRIGVETQDDDLRLKVLKKGHRRVELLRACEAMRNLGVVSGGYALLNPAPHLDKKWAEQEAIATIEWILDENAGLGMNEVYFGPTCVGPNTPLAKFWEAGEFFPASLHSVVRVLSAVLPKYEGRVHLLPFVDTPSFLAVPSNHDERGLPESLEGATGCDRAFHEMLNEYRKTLDRSVIRPIPCTCGSV